MNPSPESQPEKANAIDQPAVIPRPDHCISRANISENALKVLYRLHKEGFQAYLVGGGVRDLMLGREPKDFDVATDAHPEEIRRIFRNCRLIGRRFRLAHVHFGREIIEVATFRAAHNGEEEKGGVDSDTGMILRDNVYGTVEEDALRRDFTINALYYNIADFSVVDFTGGAADLEQGLLRPLGDPETRFREDPVRMLRAARFAAKLGFAIESRSEALLEELGSILDVVPAARLFDECLKLFMGGFGVAAYEKLRHYDLFRHLFPQTEACLSREEHAFPITFVYRGLENTDARVQQDKPVTPAFLFAVLLWEPVRQRAERAMAAGTAPIPAIQDAASDVLSEQLQHVSLPKRFSIPMREIWALQPRFEQRGGKRPLRLLQHPRFRAAYDFLLLRAEAGEADPELAEWWTRFQEVDESERTAMTPSPAAKRRRRRRRKPRAASGE
jgi:poly(A) polymerase